MGALENGRTVYLRSKGKERTRENPFNTLTRIKQKNESCLIASIFIHEIIVASCQQFFDTLQFACNKCLMIPY